MSDLDLGTSSSQSEDEASIRDFQDIRDFMDNEGTGHIKIGIWGTKGAGKTSYLGRLIERLERGGVWRVRHSTSKATTTFYNDIKRTVSRGEWPAPTNAQTAIDATDAADLIEKGLSGLYCFKVRPDDGSEQKAKMDQRQITEITFYFLDAAGEYYENLEDPQFDMSGLFQPSDGGEFSIVDYLSRCHGVIMLIDPTRKEIGPNRQTYEDLFRDLIMKLLTKFPGSFDLLQFFSICFTQIDKDPFRTDYDKPEVIAARVLGKDYDNFLRNLIPRNQYKLYNTSVIGIEGVANRSSGYLPSQPEKKVYPSPFGAKPTGTSMPAMPTPNTTTTRPVPSILRKDTGRSEDTTSVEQTQSKPAPHPDNTTTRANPSANKKAPPFSPDNPPLNVTEPLDWLLEQILEEPPDIAGRRGRR